MFSRYVWVVLACTPRCVYWDHWCRSSLLGKLGSELSIPDKTLNMTKSQKDNCETGNASWPVTSRPTCYASGAEVKQCFSMGIKVILPPRDHWVMSRDNNK